ncbi:MAG TPA: NADH-quinone oxidoreductase subunit C [Dissulfurispiraceae bacterium]|nr:NADH-quinone oxidoreductase subunit C [Dissulfurispiraceae bacterium]
MTPVQISELLKSKFQSDVLYTVEFGGQVSVTVNKANILVIMKFLKASPELDFDYLVDLCGADYMGRKNDRFEVVYNLRSISHNHCIRIKAVVPENDCKIASVVGIWAGADWHERECFDMFGISFAGHPDLRRILMPEDWEGHPLRKDYPLKSDLGEAEWKGYKEVVETAERNKQYEVR